MYSPERIILGGVVLHGKCLSNRVSERVGILLGGYAHIEYDKHIVKPILGDNSGIIGAIALVNDMIC